MNYRITDFYIEPGITGTHDNRPEFIRLQHNIRIGQHKFVIFKEISRLVRDLEIWKRFFRLCQSHDCEICLRGLPFNPNDPASILQLDQLASYAEFESRTTSKRIKESNHSALITSGKFNGNYPLLGFDMIRNSDEENTGIYKPNQSELKQVEWIMKAFLRADKYKTLLQWCKEKNIKNKKGDDFKLTAIKALLTNSRYIGKWYRNKHNKDKRQHKLMPYDRYAEIIFNYGCVVDKDLWDKVQEKVKQMDELKTKGIKRCYPLSGLLIHEDGSRFVGSGAWGNSCQSNYYYNKTHKLRIRVELLEKEAETVLRQIAQNSKEAQDNFAAYMKKKDDMTQILKDKTRQIESKLSDLSVRQADLDKRLSFLLDDESPEVALSFKKEYKKRFFSLQHEKEDLTQKREGLQKAQKHLAYVGPQNNENRSILISEALKCIQKSDLMALRVIYMKFFEKIVIYPSDNPEMNKPEIEVKFVFKNATSDIGMVEVADCIYDCLVEPSGVEPLTSTLPAWRSTN